MQHGVERDFLDLGHRDDIAGHAGVGFDVLFALQHEQMAHFEWLAAIANEQLRIAPDCSLEYPKRCELAYKRVDHDFEHMGEHMFFGIRLRADFSRRTAATLEEERRIA